jgi:hypothetical protein
VLGPRFDHRRVTLRRSASWDSVPVRARSVGNGPSGSLSASRRSGVEVDVVERVVHVDEGLELVSAEHLADGSNDDDEGQCDDTEHGLAPRRSMIFPHVGQWVDASPQPAMAPGVLHGGNWPVGRAVGRPLTLGPGFRNRLGDIHTNPEHRRGAS